MRWDMKRWHLLLIVSLSNLRRLTNCSSVITLSFRLQYLLLKTWAAASAQSIQLLLTFASVGKAGSTRDLLFGRSVHSCLDLHFVYVKLLHLVRIELFRESVIRGFNLHMLSLVPRLMFCFLVRVSHAVCCLCQDVNSSQLFVALRPFQKMYDVWLTDFIRIT